jgi:hypothetical protein
MRGVIARACLAAAFLAVTLPPAAMATHRLGDVREPLTIAHRGVVFPAPRPSRAACQEPVLDVAEPPAPVTRITPLGEDGSDRRVEPMTWYVMTAIGHHLHGCDDGLRALATLGAWAEAHALEALEPAGPQATLARSRYTLKRALLPLIAGYAVLRRDLQPSAADRSRVEDWLARLVALAEGTDGPITARNNHRYMRDAVLVAWGALQGEAASFARGVQGARDAIAALQPDGSWPLEIGRGPRALWYQRHAIASLVATAEIVAGQGIDLYAADSAGRSLHQAIGFLLDGITRADPGQDLGFLAPRGNGRHYMAWAEAYLARFPDHPNTPRLHALLVAAPRPLIDDYSGGDVASLVGVRPVGSMTAMRPER